MAVKVSSHADCVSEEDRFKYIDDLTILQLICLSGLLLEYDYLEHVPSDIGVNEYFLPSDSYKTQENLNCIASWSKQNLVELNEEKCSYMVFTRTDQKFSTRLAINNCKIDKNPVHKILGIWISEDLSWEMNTKEICRKSYSRLSMLTKLKYIGTKVEDLLEINILFIQSIAEYCAVAFHSSLTVHSFLFIRTSKNQINSNCS